MWFNDLCSLLLVILLKCICNRSENKICIKLSLLQLNDCDKEVRQISKVTIPIFLWNCSLVSFLTPVGITNNLCNIMSFFRSISAFDLLDSCIPLLADTEDKSHERKAKFYQFNRDVIMLCKMMLCNKLARWYNVGQGRKKKVIALYLW